MGIKKNFNRKRVKILIIGFIAVLAITAVIFIIARLQIDKIEEPAQVEEEEIGEYIPPRSMLYQEYEEVSVSELISQGREREEIIPEMVVDDKAYISSLSRGNDSIYYYSTASKNFIEYDLLTGNGKPIFTDAKIDFENIYEIEWSPTEENKAIIRNDDGYHLMDFSTNKTTSLNVDIIGAKWSPNGQKIVYQYISLIDNVDNIAIADPDGSNWRNIASISLNELDYVGGRLDLAWSPDGRNILYTYPATSLDNGDIYSVNIDTGETKILASYGQVFGYFFSPNGNKVLYSSIAEGVPQVWVMDNDGSDKKYTGMENIVTKCVWRKNNIGIICAVSNNIYSFDGELSDDIIVEYNIENERSRQLTSRDPENILDVSNLMINNEDNVLYFTNYNGNIDSINL